MTLRHALATIPLAILVACGSSNGKVYTISGGNYKLSSVSAVPPDNCNIATAFPDDAVIAVAVASGVATFNLGTSGNPDRQPSSTISDNTIAEGSKTYSSNEVITTCTEEITVSISGEILADDEFSGTLKYSSTPAAGATNCDASGLGYKVYPCASTMTFQAKKQ